MNHYLGSLFFLVTLLAVLAFAQDLEQIQLNRLQIQQCYNQVQKQLSEVNDTKEMLLGMKIASEVVVASNASIESFASDEVTTIAQRSVNQVKEILEFEQDLMMRSSILQRAMDLIVLNMTQLGYSNTGIKRFASNYYGTAIIASNGTIYYTGNVDPTICAQGFPTTLAAYVETDWKPVDMSPLIGRTAVQVFPSFTNFYVLTGSGILYVWGRNYGNRAGVGQVGGLCTMKRVDFGLITKPFKIKKAVCDTFDPNNGAGGPFDTSTWVNYESCYVLTEEGEIYYWGNIGIVYDKPTKLPISIGGVEHKASDLAVSSTISTYPTFQIISKTDGKVYSVGNNAYGGLGDGTTTSKPNPISAITNWGSSWSPVTLPSVSFVKVFAMFRVMFGLTANGVLYTWGTTSFLARTVSITSPNTLPAPINSVPGLIVTDVCTNPISLTAIILDQFRQPYVIGLHNGERFYTPYLIPYFKGKSVIDCDMSHTIATLMFSDGKTYSMGTSSYAPITKTTYFAETNLPVY